MEKNLKSGDWLFTCHMKPMQFDMYCPRDPNDYGKRTDEFLEWCKFDDFTTTEGSSHSQKNCGCKPITVEYAKWFLENNINKLYNGDIDDCWTVYENKVKERCKKDNIEYEGI